MVQPTLQSLICPTASLCHIVPYHPSLSPHEEYAIDALLIQRDEAATTATTTIPTFSNPLTYTKPTASLPTFSAPITDTTLLTVSTSTPSVQTHSKHTPLRASTPLRTTRVAGSSASASASSLASSSSSSASSSATGVASSNAGATASLGAGKVVALVGALAGLVVYGL